MVFKKTTKILQACIMGLLLFSLSAPAYLDIAVPSKTATKETVVLMHGLGRGKASMWRLALRLESAGFSVKQVDYDSLYDATISGIRKDISQQIDLCCAQSPNKVHFVGHSLGGLLIRAYLGKNKIKTLGRVVLMGSPNHGTPIVDKFSPWMDYAGQVTQSLGTKEGSFPSTLPVPYYPLGVIAGISNTPISGLIPGPDDGLVSVYSTRVKGMQDFVVVKTGHGRMRYNKEVANQTIQFLRTGKFTHTKD